MLDYKFSDIKLCIYDNSIISLIILKTTCCMEKVVYEIIRKLINHF